MELEAAAFLFHDRGNCVILISIVPMNNGADIVEY